MKNKEEILANKKEIKHNLFILAVSMIAVILILATNYIPRSTSGNIAGISLSVLPFINAVLNGVSFLLLIGAMVMIKKKRVHTHKRFIYGALTSTVLFMITYLTYHAMAGSTSYGGSGLLLYIYYFVLITHIILATSLLPLVLITFIRGQHMLVKKHRKIARWTMPIWLYVSFSGVLVYVLISPYYE